MLRAGTLGFCSMLCLEAYSQSALTQSGPVGPSVRETLQWLSNKLEEIEGNDSADRPEFSRWVVSGFEGCSIAIRETMYSNGLARLVTDWTVQLKDISAEYLRDQIRFEETFREDPTDMKVRLKYHRGRAFEGLAEQKETATPEVVMTRELVLSIPTGEPEVEIEIERALLYAAVGCSADPTRLE